MGLVKSIIKTICYEDMAQAVGGGEPARLAPEFGPKERLLLLGLQTSHSPGETRMGHAQQVGT